MLNHSEIQEVSNAVAEQVFSCLSQKMTPGRWLTMSQALDYAKIKSKNNMLKWIKEGLVYGFRRSGTWIIDRDSIDQWYTSELFNENFKQC